MADEHPRHGQSLWHELLVYRKERAARAGRLSVREVERLVAEVEAEERHYAMLEQSDMAAWLKQNGLRQTRSGSGRMDGSFWVCP